MSLASCTCTKCVSACRRVPGLFSPLEALAAIRAGFARDLMARWDQTQHPNRPKQMWQSLLPLSSAPSVFQHLIAGTKHHRNGPWDCFGNCTFLTRGDRCALHHSGFKPIECRVALCCDDAGDDNPSTWDIRDMWNSSVGRHVVAIWQRELTKQTPTRKEIERG